ncbi:MAG: 8-oxoguanine deaminase [Lachnospiraceae bacterium]|nr:8-oxoguanine deaminase [Lachnospiraceae bacterium]
MAVTLIKNIDTIVSCDEKDTVYRNADILIRDNLIVGIYGQEGRHGDGSSVCDFRTEEPSPCLPQSPTVSGSAASLTGPAPAHDRVIDGTGMFCYPGLINTHHHLYQMFSRNLPEVQNMELFDWLKTLYEIWKNLDEDVIRLSSLTGMGELMKYGCTTCFDHHYVFPHGSGDLIGTQFAAADELGIRMYASRGSMDLSVKDGGLPPDSVVQTVDEIMRDSAELIDRFNDKSYGAMHRIALAPCSPFSVSKELLKESAVLAREYGVRLHTHLCETLDEERYMLEREGMRPLAYMESLSWVGDDVWFAHGIHFNDDELDTLAVTGTGVAHCPISNMKLSSGIARIPEMLAKGIKVGLAVDGSASNDGSNLLEEIRVAYLLHRLNSSKSAPSGYDILKIATAGSASVLGRDDIGSLAPGKCADLFLVDSRRFELTGAGFDPASVFATVGLKGPADLCMVNGRVTVENGRLTAIDEERTAYDANRKCREYLGR